MAAIASLGRPSRWAILAGLALLAVGSWSRAGAAGEGPAPAAERGALIRLEGVITPLMEHYLYRKLDQARKLGAGVVILELDSPGGALDATLNMSDRLNRLDWARTIAYVPRQALSGAAILALACDEIIMAPDARLGDAGPVFQGKDALFRHAPEKIRSELVRRVRDLAEAHGRPPALAEAMVDPDVVVYHVQPRGGGPERLMSEHEIEASDDPGQWIRGKPVLESREGLFLEVNGRRAVELGLADALASDRDELRGRCRLKSLAVLHPTAADFAVVVLNRPVVTGLLLVIGLIALYVELSAPGISVGGLLSALCFALFFWSRFLGGTAGMLEVILFLAGVVFVLVELFVIPGFGLAGIGGLLLIAASIVLASQTFVVPETERQWETLTDTLAVLAASIFIVAAAAWWMARHFHAIPLLGRLSLAPPSLDSPEAEEEEQSGEEPDRAAPVRPGAMGRAVSPLRPAGKVEVNGRILDVVADGQFVEPGRPIRVVEVRGNHIVVRESDG